MSGDCGGCELSRRSFLWGTLVLAGLPLARLAALSRNGEDHVYAMPAQDGAAIDRENQIILVRYQSHVYAFSLSCPHQNTALRWIEADQRFQCPKHHSKYQPDGVFISGRATRGMDRHAIRRDGDTVVVSLDVVFRDDVDHAGWLAASIQL